MPTHDGIELLKIVLPSLQAQRYHDFSVTVVDDASTDPTAPWLAEQWPVVAVLRLASNVGVAAALNRGAAAQQGELVALLNNDLELDPGWLEVLVAELDAHPTAAWCGGKQLRYHDRRRLDGAGDVIGWSTGATRRGHGELDSGRYDRPEWIFSAGAGAALYRRAALEQVGGFDEDFLAYGEDSDWGLRAQLRGLRCRYVPAAVAYHIGAATTGRDRSDRYQRLLWRNTLLLTIKNIPLDSAVRHAPGLLALPVRLAAISRRQGRLRTFAAALVEVASMLPTTLRKRRAIQRGRVADRGSFERVFEHAPARRGSMPTP